jgi:toxin ParE1/3/4
MARKLIFRRGAERDLNRLYEFIRDEAGPEIAITYVRRLRAYCESFETFPERGRRRDDIRPGLRLIGFERRAVIAFTVKDNAIEIGRVFYGGRDVEALLGS